VVRVPHSNRLVAVPGDDLLTGLVERGTEERLMGDGIGALLVHAVKTMQPPIAGHGDNLSRVRRKRGGQHAVAMRERVRSPCLGIERPQAGASFTPREDRPAVGGVRRTAHGALVTERKARGLAACRIPYASAAVIAPCHDERLVRTPQCAANLIVM